MTSSSPWYTPVLLSDVEEFCDVLESEADFELAWCKDGSMASPFDNTLETPSPTWTFDKFQNACLPLPDFPTYEKKERPLLYPQQVGDSPRFSPPFLAVNNGAGNSIRQIYEDNPVAYVRMPASRFFGQSKKGLPPAQQRGKPVPPPMSSHSFEKFINMRFNEIQSFESKSFDFMNPQPFDGPKTLLSKGPSSEAEGEPPLTEVEKNRSSPYMKPPTPPESPGCSWLSPGLIAAISSINNGSVSQSRRYSDQKFDWAFEGYGLSPSSARRDSACSQTDRLPLSAWNPEYDLKMNTADADDLNSWPSINGEPNFADLVDFELEKPPSPQLEKSTRATSQANLFIGSWNPENPECLAMEERGYTEPIIGTGKFDPLVSSLENLPKSDGLLNPPTKVVVPDRYPINRETGFIRTFNYGLRTTIRFTGLGNFCSRESVLKWLTEELQLGLFDFDFLYVPVDLLASRSVGYTFINFKCISKMTQVIGRISSKEGVYFLDHRVSWDFARVQGFANLQALFRNHKLSTNFPITCANGTVIPILAQCHDGHLPSF